MEKIRSAEVENSELLKKQEAGFVEREARVLKSLPKSLAAVAAVMMSGTALAQEPVGNEPVVEIEAESKTVEEMRREILQAWCNNSEYEFIALAEYVMGVDTGQLSPHKKVHRFETKNDFGDGTVIHLFLDLKVKGGDGEKTAGFEIISETQYGKTVASGLLLNCQTGDFIDYENNSEKYIQYYVDKQTANTGE